jgi:hypothetical protein
MQSKYNNYTESDTALKQRGRTHTQYHTLGIAFVKQKLRLLNYNLILQDDAALETVYDDRDRAVIPRAIPRPKSNSARHALAFAEENGCWVDWPAGCAPSSKAKQLIFESSPKSANPTSANPCASIRHRVTTRRRTIVVGHSTSGVP